MLTFRGGRLQLEIISSNERGAYFREGAYFQGALTFQRLRYHPSAYISLKFHAYKCLVVLLRVLGWMYVLRVEGGG